MQVKLPLWERIQELHLKFDEKKERRAYSRVTSEIWWKKGAYLRVTSEIWWKESIFKSYIWNLRQERRAYSRVTSEIWWKKGEHIQELHLKFGERKESIFKSYIWNLRQERKNNYVQYWALSEPTWYVEWFDKLCTSCPVTASSRTDRWWGTDHYCVVLQCMLGTLVFVLSTKCWHRLQDLLTRICDLLHAQVIHTGTLLYFCRVCREFWLWRNGGGGGGGGGSWASNGHTSHLCGDHAPSPFKFGVQKASTIPLCYCFSAMKM